jgi:hypothetical protein
VKQIGRRRPLGGVVGLGACDGRIDKTLSMYDSTVRSGATPAGRRPRRCVGAFLAGVTDRLRKFGGDESQDLTALAAKQATTSIPTVMAGAGDPVGHEPGGHVIDRQQCQPNGVPVRADGPRNSSVTEWVQ